MTLFFLMGLIMVAFILFFRASLFHFIGENNRFVLILQNTKWFQNVWPAGLFLFVMNTILFSSTLLILYLIMTFSIPFVHLFVMMLAVVVSIVFWMSVNKAWLNSNKNRIKMAAIGSSFYLLLTFLFLYLYVTIKPFYPGEDTFMRALGISLAMIVTFVAWICCFVITGFAAKTHHKKV